MSFKIIFFIIFLCVFFAFAANAKSSDDLVAVFDPNPLFGNVNFAPGQKITASIEVKNKSGTNKPLAIQAIRVDDPDMLGDSLFLEIKENGRTLFYGSLTSFFNVAEIFLSDLADQASTTYEMIIDFDESAADQFQGKTLRNFDIGLGFQGEEVIGAEINGVQSGGGGYFSPALVIFDENTFEIGETYATINWTTSKPGTSRVIYDTFSRQDISYEHGPNYGYMFSTKEDASLVIGHSLVIYNLIPDTTYYFRPISHSSPEKIGEELSLTTLGRSVEEVEQELPAVNLNGSRAIDEEKNFSLDHPVASNSNLILEQADEQSGRTNLKDFAMMAELPATLELNSTDFPIKRVAGAVVDNSCKQKQWWMFVLVLFGYLLTLGSYYRYLSKKKFKHWIYFPIILSIAVILLIIALTRCLI
ncbi:hypothetical protein COV56_02420 [Candidatus Kuenenbacteria bacterium CG11_big_fil_rev_8_21_14_0_20_37_9]|nr:MAG: hypothetical protein COV56_02420 [Candidatus Kuenenbacteria bacterium CG11_big_fil_rev_8_21_14_0_20_37_9]